jgi:hypothetical protein
MLFEAHHERRSLFDDQGSGRIEAHQAEIIATLKPSREAIAEICPQIQELDYEQYIAFRNSKAEEIEIKQAALSAMEAAAAAVLPVMKANGCAWGSGLAPCPPLP